MKVNINFDMDGVLAKWNQNASEEETHIGGYFISRDADEKAVALAKRFLNAIDRFYAFGLELTVTALSAVYTDEHSATEKDAWLNKVGLKDIKRLFIPYGEDKSKYIEQGEDVINVLIDDYGKNLRAWSNAGYLAVKYYNGINDMPKLKIVDGVVNIDLDTWDGYSINNKMSVDMMFQSLFSLIVFNTSMIA